MKFLHLADLHIGKRVNDFSMIDDQIHILSQIISIIDEQKPYGVIIAGDVYDKAVPTAEAVELLDDFLWRILSRDVKIFMISGNHDSAERLAFGSKIMCQNGLYIAKAYAGTVEKISVTDDLHIHLLPFIKPIHVKRYFPDEEISSYTDAVKVTLKDCDLSGKNILITHQFVTGSQQSDSEEISVGGSDNVDVSAFDGFDYVALGHIHKPQKVGADTIRYSGTPLKYSFSEASHQKSVTIIDVLDEVTINTVALTPKRDLREIKCKFDEITERSDDYMRVILTDEDDIINVWDKLRMRFPNLMALEYDNTRTRAKNQILLSENVQNKSPLELFSELFETQNGQPLSQEQESFLTGLIENIWEG